MSFFFVSCVRDSLARFSCGSHAPVCLAMTSSAGMQTILQQLHRQLAAASQPPPTPSASAAMPLPQPWRPTSDLLRQMRAVATSMYEQVLDQHELEKAKEWGWTPTPNNEAVEDEAAAPTHAPSQPHMQLVRSTASFHRFSVPLAPLLDEFLAATAGVRQILSYHTALISCLQAVSRAPPTPAASGGGSTSQQLSQLSRNFLFTLKQRVELQRQVMRVQNNFAKAQQAVQQELQRRKRRQTAALASVVSDSCLDEVSFPACDVFSVAASLGLIRSRLSLVNAQDDPSKSCEIQPPGSVEFSSEQTIDGRDARAIVDDLQNDHPAVAGSIPRLTSSVFSCEKHLVNISSTGRSECFVADLTLVKPLLRSNEDRQALMEIRKQVAALPHGLDSLPRLSSLSQILRYGFAVSGRLEFLSEWDHYLSGRELALIFQGRFLELERKLKWRTEMEALCDQVNQPLWQREGQVREAMRSVESKEGADAVPELLGRVRMHQQIEGPCVTCTDRRAADTPATLHSARSSFSITYVGAEKVYDFAVAAATAGAQAMDTSAGSAAVAAAASSFSALPVSFAYRFVFSHPLLLRFSDAVTLFGWPAAAAASSAAVFADQGPFPRLLYPEPASYRPGAATCIVQTSMLGFALSYSVPAQLVEPSVLLSSFLCRSLDDLPVKLKQCRTHFLIQRLFDTITEPIDPTLQPATNAATAPVGVAPAAITTTGPIPRQKFSYHEQMMREQADSLNEQRADPLNSISNVFREIRVLSSLGSLELAFAHPFMQGEVRVTIHAGDATLVSVRCANDVRLYDKYASAVLQRTGSIPILVHALLQKLSRW